MMHETEVQAYGKASNPKIPTGVKASDETGERKGSIVATENKKEKMFNGGKQSGICYTHDNKFYQK